MKKSILTFAIVALGLFTFNASAQDNTTTGAAQTCCQTGKVKAKAKKAKALEGLNLTADQQTAVSALNQKYADARKDAKKAKKEEAKKNRQARKENKRAYLKEMQQILTPEQYVVYLENIVVSQPAPNAKMAKSPKGKMAGKKGPKDGHKKGPKAMRGAKTADVKTNN